MSHAESTAILHQNMDEAETILRQELTKLDITRKTLEHEADAIYLELTTPPDEGVEPMGIDTPLVDEDGNPRGDIDLFRTRTLRRRFRELKTDHKEISKRVEQLLIQLAIMKVSDCFVALQSVANCYSKVVFDSSIFFLFVRILIK